jgi:ATP-dependent exoDNAse (exonuclease V) alpha subunit
MLQENGAARPGLKEISRAQLGDVETAFAMTIHKSQGSEYPAVVIPVMTQHYPMHFLIPKRC